MQLISRSLRGRTFLIQFIEIMREFGAEIPWLEPLQNVAYATNAVYVRDRLLRAFGCQDSSEVTPYQFVTSDESREYVGGIVHFAQTPEVFVDRENQGIAEHLAHEDFHYISCLQVRGVWRGQGQGSELMRRALAAILRTHPRVWGVASSFQLLPWYASFGGRIWSPRHNADNLWIVSWQRESTENKSPLVF